MSIVQAKRLKSADWVKQWATTILQEEIKRQSDDVARRIIDGGRFRRYHIIHMSIVQAKRLKRRVNTRLHCRHFPGNESAGVSASAVSE
jgi:hypothetical protein